METSFSTQETEIVEKTYAKAKFIFYVCVTSAIGCLSGSILETFFTVSQEELDLLSHIYDRKYPNNRLQTNFWVPDIDDSEPPYYQIIFVTELYLIYLIILLTILSVSLIPMLVTHIAGQYEILCNRIQSLGHSSIMWNKRRPIDDLQDRESLRSIMQAHKNLISAQSKLQNLYSAGMFIKVVFNNIMFALCLYQLTLSNTNTVSKFRVYKLTLEFLTVAVTYYYLCHCSEILDDCNSKLCDAIWNSRWYHCSRHVQKDLIMFLRRVQRPNHLKCLHGAIILSHVYFLGVVKVSYSFVNCMRFKSRL
ncbi:odorant receptor Or2-like [Diaphorina citri]|nr:odorant receptor Or2-like [Diaphorina citri]KAI5725524.1 hypothetical protein M8J77_016635 [Diaphorina citri]